MNAPKPDARPRKVSLWRYMRLFRSDILSAQPDHLFDAKMAAFKTPFFRSFLINEPDLIREVLTKRPTDFPKSLRIAEGLRPLLGASVFLTNGAEWERQRRIIDPAFEAGRLAQVFPALRDAAQAASDRLHEGEFEAEEWAAHAAADAIFRMLFSVPIEDALAAKVFNEFQAYQRAQPLLNLAAFVPVPGWVPRMIPKRAKRAAAEIRDAISQMVERRAAETETGGAPDDLATRIMTTPDPVTGKPFSSAEMIDQVAIFFLAGHETSASALAWAMYLLASHKDAQTDAANEVRDIGDLYELSQVTKLKFVKDCFRETLRLYPPVPMMVREATKPETFRKRLVRRGAQIVISPWHLHRHRLHWANPDAFSPGRFQTERDAVRDAYLPFSSGPRVCPGAGIAMIEGPLFLAAVLKDWTLAPAGPAPVPVAHLTIRSRSGIQLKLTRR